MNGLLRAVWKYTGLNRLRKLKFPSDFSESEIETCLRVAPFTMTSRARIVAAIHAAEYVAKNRIPGGIVECGVWRGGSMMAIALTLLRLQRGDIPLYLFDTFEGMSEPTAVDGREVHQRWRENQTRTHNSWCFASLEDVQANVAGTGYDMKLCSFLRGKVEDTLPSLAPERISLLRLDTDWYESTRHELEHLFPRLSRGGVLIIDDYGHWKGCRKAVDEYIQQHGLQLLLNRCDSTGRIAVKL